MVHSESVLFIFWIIFKSVNKGKINKCNESSITFVKFKAAAWKQNLESGWRVSYSVIKG